MTISKMNSNRLCQAVALSFLIFVNITSVAEGLGEDAILEFLEKLRVRMCHPIPQLGLPALDPLQIMHAETKMDNKYLVNFNGSVTDLKLIGLSDFIINDFKISTLRKSIFNITLPMTAFESIYTAKGSLAYITNLAGDGHGNAHLSNFRLVITFNLKLGKYLGIRNLDITITVGEVNIDFESLFEEERINNFFHALVNELSLELLGDLWTDEKTFVQEYLQERVNAFIGQYTLADVIAIIGGGGDGEPIFENGPPGDCKDSTTFNETEAVFAQAF